MRAVSLVLMMVEQLVALLEQSWVVLLVVPKVFCLAGSKVVRLDW